MRILYIVVLLSLLSVRTLSQQVSGGEYFVDADPGIGNGIPFSILPADSITHSLSIATSTLLPGWHILYFRTFNTSQQSSLSEGRSFFVEGAPATSNAIVSAEYFFNTDPGPGNGNVINSFNNDSINYLASIPVTGLSEGHHLLYVRTKDINEKWSLSERRSLYIYNLPAADDIVAAEYFFNTDPGTGNGIPYSLGAPVPSVDTAIAISVPPLPLGVHYLYVRTKNSRGQWSLHEARQIKICVSYGADAAFDYVVSGNKVYFNNNSQFYSAHSWDFGDGNTESVQVNPMHEYPSGGSFTVCLSAADSCGSDVFCETIHINGIKDIHPSSAGNTGVVNLHLNGYGFEPGASVRLVRDGFPDIIADTNIYISGSEYFSRIKLSNAALGFWDVVVLNPSGNNLILESGFEAEPVEDYEPWISVVGARKVLVNRTSNIRVAFGNHGNTTAYAVPLYIKVTGNRFPLVISREDTTTMPASLRDSVLSSTRFFTVYDSITGDSSNVAAMILPFVEPGTTQFVDIVVLSTILGNYEVEARLLEPLFSSAELDSIGVNRMATSCNFIPQCFQCLLDLMSLVPPLACGVGIAGTGCSIGGYAAGYGNQTVYDIAANITGTIIACTPLSAVSTAVAVAQSVTSMAASSLSAAQSCLGENGCGKQGPKGFKVFPTAASMDPNVKEGPTGLDAQNYVSGKNAFNYRIFFENADTATAPASEVLLIDTLDPASYDFSTFSFSQFGFGDSVYSITFNEKMFATDIDLRPLKNIILRVKGQFDVSSGIMKVRFTSFDPVTMDLTDSIDEGFLPPNVTSPEGEGFVSYSIGPLSSLVHLQQVLNDAEIVFDLNDPIITPQWVNTIDKEKPQSQVLALSPVQSDSIFTVSWTGSDAHAGVMDFAIYVSEDSGPYELWLFAAEDTSALFYGHPGHIYKFYSVARDNVSNMEDAPLVADAETSVLVSVDEQNRMAGWMNQNIPNPFSGKTTVEFFYPVHSTASMLLTDLAGKEVMKIFENKKLIGFNRAEINAAGISSGVYLLKLISEKSIHVRRIVVLTE